MCKYALVKKMISNGTFSAAVSNGLISTNALGHKDVYEYYLKIKGTYDKKSTVVTVVSEDKRVSENTVYRIIRDFGC